MTMIRFLKECLWSTPHPDEPQFYARVGDVVDLASVTRSPELLASQVLGGGFPGHAELAEPVVVVETVVPVEPEVEVKPAEPDALETKPMLRRKARPASVLD